VYVDNDPEGVDNDQENVDNDEEEDDNDQEYGWAIAHSHNAHFGSY